MIHGIYPLEVFQEGDKEVRLALFVPASSAYFDDHFPAYKLLPAVAQIELVTRFADRYWHTGIYVVSARRIKFTNPIRPDSRIILELSRREEPRQIAFAIKDDQGKSCSSGALILGDA